MAPPRAAVSSRRCAVPGCSSERSEGSHRFPKDPEKSDTWKRAVRNAELDKFDHRTLHNRYFICKRHFSSNDFVPQTTKSMLRKSAVPSLLLPSSDSNVKTAPVTTGKIFITIVKRASVKPLMTSTCLKRNERSAGVVPAAKRIKVKESRTRSMIKHNFPPLKNDRILKAARGEDVDKAPVWIMRQAGRYLPEFKEIRAKHDFFSICQTPSLACEVTLQPIERFDLDAAIIFSDILVIPQAMGLVVEMRPGVGPVLPDPLSDPSHLSRLVRPNVESDLGYVGSAVTLTRQNLGGKVPLIGFTGAPWTLMGYMIQGGGSSTMAQARSWLYKYPEASHELLQLLTDVIVDYLVMQVQAGAQLLQIFESNGDYLDDALFKEFSLRYFIQISKRVREKLEERSISQVPMIAFPKGATMKSLEMLAKSEDYEVIGLDWTVDPLEARTRLGPNVTLQGNMDPCALYGTEVSIYERAEEMVQRFGKNRYIANLGHGILPDIPISSVDAFISGVHFK